MNHTCPTCKTQWPTNYCPQCARTIDRSASPPTGAQPPILAPPLPQKPRVVVLKPIKRVILVILAVALAGLALSLLLRKSRQADDQWPTVSQLRKEIRAAADGASQPQLQKALAQGDEMARKMDLRTRNEYAPLGATTDEILAHENDDKKADVLPALVWGLGQKIEKQGWDRLTDTERRLVAVQYMDAEVLDGGFDEYFFNSPGGDAEVALAGLKDMGATVTASLLERAMDVFPVGKPPTDQQERWKVMDKIESSSKPVWKKCDDEFYRFPEDLDRLSLVYAKKNRAQIILP
jgi:Domain of unknown function (DUF4375)